MDTKATTAAFSRGAFAPRDHGTHRRAYLDTYAKRRAPATAQTSVQSSGVIPNASNAPALESVEIAPEKPEEFMQVQPSSTSFTYHHVAEESTLPRRSYLDTLHERHQRAVSSAPHAEETVLTSQLDLETESLFDEATNLEREQKLEANLSALYAGSLTEQIAKNATSASASHVRTIVMSALACGVMSVGIFTFMSKYDSAPVVAQPIGASVIEVESSNTTRPSGTPASHAVGPVAVDPSHPVKVVISSIGVNAPVEGLGTTPEGLMAVPKSYGVVGWYNKGSVPGKAGPAVFVGHYAGGNGAVFDGLANVKDGDLITTTNGRGQSFTYKVTALKEYQKDAVPMTEIFKSGKNSRLEIITCSGKWQANTYNNRLVVTAELVQ